MARTTATTTTKVSSWNWKYMMCFLLGIAASKGMDSVMEMMGDLWARGLINSGWGLSSSETNNNNAAAVSSIRSTITNPTMVLKRTSTTATTPMTKEQGIMKQQQQQQQSAFDEIVTTAYDRVTNDNNHQGEMPRSRPHFSIQYWEKESGHMTNGGLNRQDRILLGAIYGNATSVFEYGLGESTFIAHYVGVPRYAGIDSDPQWIAMARDEVAPHFRFYLGDIGPTGNWGFPKYQQKLDKFVLDYQLSPLIVEQQPFDVYMVDGRWRLPCMLASFLHASAHSSAGGAGIQNSTATVLIHDCDIDDTRGRTQYKKADHLLELVAHSGNKLCVYKRKADTTDDQLRDLWHQYMDQMIRR